MPRSKKFTYAFGILALFATSAFAGNFLFQTIVGKPMEARHIEKTIESNYSFLDNIDMPVVQEGIYNFLLLGVDEREEDFGRSDTIVIASVNFKEGKVGLTSIPRDTMVEIPTHGQTKINHAYAYGGERLTKIIVEQTLGLKIDHYIIVNFSAFKRIVNALGGVDMFVEKDMYYRDDYDGPDGFTIDLKKGKQHLDGDKALQYVRFRDEEGDIGRAERQQKFLKEMSKKLLSTNLIIEAPNVIRQVNASIKTDISFKGLVNFIRSIDSKKGLEIKPFLLAGHPEMIDELSYWILDKEESKAQLLSMNDFVTDARNFIPQEQKPQNNQPKEQKPKEQVPNKEQDKPEEKSEEKKQDNIFLAGDPRDLDWQIAKLAENAEAMKTAREKLLQEEREEKELRKQEEEAERIRALQEKVQTSRVSSNNGITVINTTDDESKAQEAIAMLEDAGIPIGAVSAKGTGKPNKKTIFVVANEDKDTISAMRGLSFKFSTLYRNKMERPTLIIGEDF